MYRSVIQIYLVGFDDDEIGIIEDADPLESFSHQVYADRSLNEDRAAAADVIFANIREESGQQALSLAERLLAAKRESADLVVVASREVISLLEPLYDQLADMWVAPLQPSELRYRFTQWQRRYKMATDAWETSQYLEATINSIPCLVWYKTRDGIHEKVNDSFCETVGKTKEQVQGQGHAYIWDVEQDDPACIESEREVMATRATCISEEAIQTGEGTRLLETYKSPLYNPDGEVMGTVGVAIDITQERAYEASLIEKNRTLETIFTTMDCGVLTHTFDGSRIVGVNQAALNILGYESEKDLMAHGFDMIAPSVLDEDKSKLREQIASLTTVGDSVSTEYRVRHESGEIFYVMGNIKVIEKDGEKLYQRFLLDCTAQKLKEEQRELHQRDLLQALGNDYLVVCAFSVDTGLAEPLRIFSGADADLERIFGGDMTFEESLRYYVDTRVCEEDKERLHEALSRSAILETLGKSEQFSVLYRTWDTRYRQATIARAGSWNGDRYIVVGIRNVDQRMREELEQKTLLEEALVRANHANEAKSVFLSNMSHDIRTPMNAIVGFTTLAVNHIDETERVREFLDKIKTSSTHLLGLINDILDMSRIESGKMFFDEKQRSLTEMLDDLQTIVQAEADAKDLSLSISTDVAHDSVICDRLKVNQILLNIVGNSIKFTPAGGSVDISLAEFSEAPEGFASYRLVVQDTGVGMSEEFVDRIFDPFERERSSTVSGVQGTGLGMSIVKSLVDIMHGTIKVESKVGVGSKFTVVLTLRIADVPDEKPAACAASSGLFPSEHVKDYRILLVDDNLLNREIGIMLLTDAGFEVEYAEDGQMAIDMLKASAPDYYKMVLMDIQMPVMNGYEAAKIIRDLEDPYLSQIPILAVTADAFDEDRQKALSCGMNGHLAKPIEIERLLEMLDALLG